MKNILMITALVGTLTLIGCTVGAKDIKPSQAKNMSTAKLCYVYGRANLGETNRLPNIRAELISRRAFSAKEWKLIDRQAIQVGMSKNAMFCSFGMPYDLNRNSYGRDQYIYKQEGSEYKRHYIYIENNIVTAWN